jgi:hypothetical protein
MAADKISGKTIIAQSVLSSSRHLKIFISSVQNERNMITFAIANRERVISIHSFHDPARGLTSVGLKLVFYCIMRHLSRTCSVCTVLNVRTSGDFAKSPLLRRSGPDSRRALQGSARSSINPIQFCDRVQILAPH